MKILVLLTLCLLCISIKSVQGKNLTLTFAKNFCPKGIKCFNSTSFAFCKSTDDYFAIGKQIYNCPIGKKCDDSNLKSCFTQEIANKLKEDRRINFYINYNDHRKASKSNRTQHINVILKIKKRKLQPENEIVTPNPEIDTNIPTGTVETTTEAEDHSDESSGSDESTESAENKSASTESDETPDDVTTTTETPYESDTNVKAQADKSSKAETSQVSTEDSSSSESSEEGATESVEETPNDSTNEPVEEETLDDPTIGPVEEERTRYVPIKSEPRAKSIHSTLPESFKRRMDRNEDRGFYVQFIRQGRKKEHLEYATFVNLDYGSMADYMPAYLKRYSEIRMHLGGLRTVNKTCFGHIKSDGIYGIKFEGLLEDVSPGTFNDLRDLVWVKLNGHLLKKIESYVFTNLYIREIDLQDNMINYLAPNAFDNMPYLERIDMTQNNLKEYDPRWFYNDHRLADVIFSNNYLQKIPAFAFKNLDVFSRKINFYFDQNSINKVHRNVYFKTPKDARRVPDGWVNTFFLNSNNLHCVPEIVMKRTRHLSLEDNPLSCGCIRRLKIVAQERHGDNTTSMRLTRKSAMACLL